MLKIGITGGIGSGKSTVSKIFELLGVPVYYSDEIARGLMDEDRVVKNKIIALADKNIILENGSLDRKAIAAVVFNDKKKLQQLNEIIHPAVANHFEKWFSFYKNKTGYILKETAILFESGANKQMDKVIVVTAPKQLRVKRVTARDKSKEEQIEQRIKNQMSEEELIKLADFVIVNDETKSVIEQILAIHSQIIT